MPYLNLGAQYFPAFNSGKPISAGYVYVGRVNFDPEIEANQIAVNLVLQDGTKIPIEQPIRTSAGGVVEYNGSPAIVEVESDYSIKVLDSFLNLVYYFAEVSPGEGQGISIGYSKVVDDGGGDVIANRSITCDLSFENTYRRVTGFLGDSWTYTIPPESDVEWTENAEIKFHFNGVGFLRVIGGSGVTIDKPNYLGDTPGPTIRSDGDLMTLKRIGPDQWEATTSTPSRPESTISVDWVGKLNYISDAKVLSFFDDPAEFFADGDEIHIIQDGTGEIEFADTAQNSTINSAGGKMKIAEQYGAVTLKHKGGGDFWLWGALKS